MLYSYGVRLGARLLLRGKLRYSMPYLIRPVNYWRALEYRLVVEQAGFRCGDKILDIGSPKLLALYLAKFVGAEVFATDVDDYFVAKYRYVRSMEGIAPERLHLCVEDGRSLSFADGCFDKVYSISVLEHIPGQGDTACAREIGRVLSTGGESYITVPFWTTSRDEYVEHNGVYWAGHSTRDGTGRVFYQRRYSERDLYERIIKPSGLRLRKLCFVGEHVMARSRRELSDYLPAISGPVQPFLSSLLHTRPVESWQDLKKPLCAMIVLAKV